MGKIVYRIWLFIYQITGVIAAGAMFQFATEGAFDWPWLQQWLLIGVGFSLFIELVEFFVRLKRGKSIPEPEDRDVQRRNLIKWNASEKLAGAQTGKLTLGEDFIALSNAEQTHLIPFTELESVERKGHFMPPERQLILQTANETYRIRAWHPAWFDVKSWEATLQEKVEQAARQEPVTPLT